MDELAGRIALVTGASRGIGRAIAQALADAGAAVAVHYVHGEEQAREVQSQIESAGGQAMLAQADLAQSAEVTRLARTVKAAWGPVDILINNAGIARTQPLDEITEQDWDDLLDTNLKSAFLLTQALLPDMRSRHWGRIIFLSSVAAQTGGVIGPHYAASKAGMLGLTHSYASLLAREGITANAIAPALIVTDMTAHNVKARADLIPIGRLGEVDEVAAIAVLLVRNGYMTGQTVNVNGGWYMS